VAAFQKMKAAKVDAHNALAELETLAVKNQKTALAQKGNTVITVATAPPPVAAGKITLNFGLTSFMRPIPFETEWQKLLDDFATSDPVVGKVNLQTDFGDLAQVANKNDCFYLPYNGIPGANLKNILNLDPYLSVDKTFDAADLVGNVYEQVQRDGKTWALPINLDPTLLKYHTELFKNAGIPTPKGTWTAAEFTDALKQLKNSAKGEPFQPNSPGGSYLLMLIAAYGGLPIDYRTDPPTVNLTAPANIDAIRQVLDLAKNDYIKYETIGNVGAVLMMRNDDSAPAPITSAGVGGMRFIRGEENGQDPYQSVLYPSGTTYRPMSYGLGTAYISAKSQNPDACYRLISQIAHHPELFSAMPARRSIINGSTSALSKENVALYNQIDTLLKDKNTITFPSMFQGGQSQAGFLIEHWVFEVFDNYVQKGANLESGLTQAEQYIKGFQECIAQLPALDATNSTSAAENMKAYLDCGVKVDPRLKDFATGVR
jgi:ABC-type glycerol-3-phosphate transport system substrate-binding protein